jgi:putative MATE family efflux protein
MITALGMPFIYGYNAICGILRGIGESLWPLLLIIVAAITNVGLDLLMVAGLGMGAAGAAIATVLAQALSFSVAFVLFCRKSNSLYFELKLSSFAMKRHEALALLKYGIPMAAQTTLIHLSQLFCISFVNAYGLVAASVNGIGNNIIRFCTIYTSSINNGAAVVVGQNLGAKKYERIREIVTSGLLITSSIAVVCCLFCLLIPRQIFGFFTSDTTVLDYSAAFLRTAAISFTLGAWHAPFGAVVTGSGNARLNLIVGLLDGIVLRIGISFFLVYAMDMGVMGFFYGNALARLAPCIICTAYYFSGRWKNRALMME